MVELPTGMLLFVGGLALFLFSLNDLAIGLEAAAGPRLQRMMDHCTQSTARSVIVGIVGAVLIGSSSATIILAISFVRARLLRLSRAMAVVLGANIGTTSTSFLFSLHLGDYLPFALLLGVIIHMVASNPATQRVGRILAALGMLFFGLFLMGHVVSPLRDHPYWSELLPRLGNPITAMAIGTLLTAIIQSSSAMMGIIIVLADEQVIPLRVGLCLMMGAEIGTCADTFVASLGRNREALRVGVFQLGFNVLSVVVWLPLVAVMEAFVQQIHPDVGRQLAVAHGLLNISCAMIILPFLPLLQRVLEFIVPIRSPRPVRESALV